MAGNILESLVIKMSADVAEGVKGINRINMQLDKMGKAAQKAGKAFKALAGGITAAKFIGYSRSIIQAAVETKRFADQIGSTVEELSHLGLMSAQVGMTTEEFNSAIVTLIKNTEGAIDNLGEFARQFRKMGIDAKKFQDLEIAEQIGVIGHALRDFDEDAKNAIALRLFEKPGLKMIRLYEQFGDEILNVKGNLDKLLTTDVAEQMEDYQKTMERVSFRVRTSFQKIITPLLPFIKMLAIAFEDLIVAVEPHLVKLGELVLETVARIVLYLEDGIDKLGKFADSFNEFSEGNWWKGGKLFFGALFDEGDDADFEKRLEERLNRWTGKLQEWDKRIKTAKLGGLLESVLAPKEDMNMHVKEYEKILERAQTSVEKFEQELINTTATIGMTDRELELSILTIGTFSDTLDRLGDKADEERERLGELIIAKRYKQATVDAKAFLDQLQRQTDLMDPLLSITERFWKAHKNWDDVLTEIGLKNKAVEVGLRNQIEQQVRLQDHIAETRQEMEAARDVGRELGEIFASAFEEALVSGQRFQDFLEDLANDILRFGTRELISKPLIEAFGDFAAGLSGKTSDTGGANWISQLGAWIGGVFNFKQKGGMTHIGEPTIVGEMGPEAFIPTASGIVIPNDQLGALGGGMVINMTVNTRDADSFRQSQSQIMADISRMSKNASRRMK